MADRRTPTPSSSPAAARRRRAPGAYLNLALWQRFTLAIALATVLMVAMVVFVSQNNTNFNPSTNLAQSARANRDSEILIAQDQAPRSARLPRGLAPAAGLAQAIHTRLAAQVRQGGISGPLTAARCRAAGLVTGARRAFACTVQSGGVVYPFAGVVETTARRIILCKRDPPPVASDSVPLSPLCLP